MTFEINRRTFLQALIAAGASYILPAKASKTQVDKVWAEAQTNPWFFEVNDYGTIADEGQEDQIWAEIFDVDTRTIKTVEDLIFTLNTCIPLQIFFNVLALDEIDELKNEAGLAGELELIDIQKKIDALEEYDEPWQQFIEMNGGADIAAHVQKIDEWLKEPIEWEKSEWFPRNAGRQGKALSFFNNQPIELLNLLGVVIIEGEHPGSGYFAAELRNGIDQANEEVEALSLPFRFKKEAV